MPDPTTPILCLRCRYDLRSTPPDSSCPECGLAEHIGIFATGSAFALVFAVIGVAFVLPIARHADPIFFFGIVLPWALVGLFMLWSLLLLFVIAQRFHRSARQASLSWKAADAAAPPA